MPVEEQTKCSTVLIVPFRLHHDLKNVPKPEISTDFLSDLTFEGNFDNAITVAQDYTSKLPRKWLY